MKQQPQIEIEATTRPEKLPDWPTFRKFLEKADVEHVLGEDGCAYWLARMDGEPVAAVMARLTNDGEGEIILIGGTNVRSWIMPLEWVICEWFRREGMAKAVAEGRLGWRRLVTPLGWTEIGKSGKFEKVL